MMELTKEEQIQAIYDLKVGYTLGHADIAMLKAMARQLLAGLEQEPVAYIAKYESGAIHGTCDRDDPVKMEWLKRGMVVSPLYAAPQLPQPAVPDEYIAPVRTPTYLGFEADWNSCRAAMLQGAEAVATVYKLPFEQWLSQQTGAIDVECGCVMTEVFYHWLRVAYEAGNSPLIHDGWVAVPVDMTPEQMRAVQLNSELGAYAAANLSGAYSLFREFWDVAIAAAPDFREISNSSTKHFRENAETSTNCPHCGRKPLKNRKCSVAGCEGRHVAHGLCQKHYDIEHKNNLSRRKNIRAANKRYRARRSAAPQQEADNG